MSKKETIKRLERQLEEERLTNLRLKERIEAMEALIKGKPDDCVMGPQCKHCDHRRVFHLETGGFYNGLNTVFLCNKQMCKHFASAYEEVKSNEPAST